MQKNLSNKELVAAGHKFAANISADTPLIDMAKMVSELATQLDVALAAAAEAGKQRDQLALENVTLKNGIGFFSYGSDSGFEEHESAEKAIEAADSDIDYYRVDACDGWSEETDCTVWGVILQRATMIDERPRTDEDSYLGSHISSVCNYALLPNLATPATDAYIRELLNEAGARAVELFSQTLGSPYSFRDEKCYEDGFTRAIEVVKDIQAPRFAAQLRAGNAGKDDVKKTISALPVERDRHGYWSHPDYLAFCDGREFIPNAEWEQWMSERGLHWHVEYRDEEELEPNVDGYDLSTWQPKAPVGEGWFVGSIHDTEDGAVCIWLRAGKDGV